APTDEGYGAAGGRVYLGAARGGQIDAAMGAHDAENRVSPVQIERRADVGVVQRRALDAGLEGLAAGVVIARLAAGRDLAKYAVSLAVGMDAGGNNGAGVNWAAADVFGRVNDAKAVARAHAVRQVLARLEDVRQRRSHARGYAGTAQRRRQRCADHALGQNAPGCAVEPLDGSAQAGAATAHDQRLRRPERKMQGGQAAVGGFAQAKVVARA